MENNQVCSFVVPGYCQPKQRTFGKSFVTPPQTRAYENLVRKVAHLAMRGKEPYADHVSLEVDIICEIPVSWTMKKKQLACDDKVFPTHCDIDNQIKAISDGMNRIVYNDDRLIAGLKVRRYFGTSDSAIVIVKPMVMQ